MKKDDNAYIGHMLDLAAKAIEKTAGMSREDYDADENIRMVMAHIIQMIGEAAGRVSEGFKYAHADIPWKQIVGTRHRIVHDYMDVDYDVIWEILKRDLPSLKEKLAAILGE